MRYLTALLLVFLSAATTSEGAQSIIKSLLDTSKTIVFIQSETGGIAGGAAKPYLIKETGEILIARDVKGFKYDRVGAGVVIDPSGLILTNAHTVQQAGRITVTLHDQTQLGAELVHLAPDSDFALLKVHPNEPLPAIHFADSDGLDFDHIVYSIGNSELLKNTISEGKIIGFGQAQAGKKPGDPKYDMLEINFGLYKGDSGTPVMNNQGELLGFITAGRSNTNVTYAIPSNVAKKRLQEYQTVLAPSEKSPS